METAPGRSHSYPVGRDYPTYFPGLTPDFTGARFVLLYDADCTTHSGPDYPSRWDATSSEAEAWLRDDSRFRAVIVLCPDGSCGYMTLHLDGSVGFSKTLAI